MMNIIRADLYRVNKSKVFKIAVLLSAVSAISVAFLLYLVSKGSVAQDMFVKFSLLVDTFLVPFLSSLVIGSLVSQDFESKNIHDEIAAGNGRNAIVVAKLCSSTILTGCIVLPYALVTILGVISRISFAKYIGIPSVFFGLLGDVSEGPLSGQTILTCIGLCCLMVLIYAARVSLYLPVAFKTRKTVPVVLVAILSTFGFDILYALFKNVKGASEALKFLPYTITNDISLNASSATLIEAVCASIVFMNIMFSITKGYFRKAEIK